MKSAFWGYLLIVLGIGIIIVMIMIYSYTSTNENDYYLLKESTEAAMLDSIDDSAYKKDGTVKINKEKFVENFIRRFSETNNFDREYEINFYNIQEEPPMVNVEVKTTTGLFKIDKDLVEIPIVNRIDGILETKKS